MKAPVQFTIVPAQPGFFLVLEHEGDAFVSNPIIAWRIGVEPEDVWPITEEEIVHENHQRWAILRPDGKVTEPLRSTCDNLEQFQREIRTEHHEHLARKKARAEAEALKALALQSA